MEFSAFMRKLAGPMQRALESEGIDSFEKLTCLSEKELLRLHGIGKKGIVIMLRMLAEDGKSLRKQDE